VLAAFRGFLSWLHRRGQIREVPDFPRVRVKERDPRIIGIADQDRVLQAIPQQERGTFLALAHLGLRPGEARALTVGDYHDGWVTVDKAVKGKTVGAPIRGTKTGRSKRLPVSEELGSWIERHLEPAARLQRRPLIPNPRTGGIWPHKALQRAWNRAVQEAELPRISLYEGTKHSFATDAIRRGVPERHLQTFLGHRNVQSTRRYARLADNAMLEVLRSPAAGWRHVRDKNSATETKERRGVDGGPSRTRTRDRPVTSPGSGLDPAGTVGVPDQECAAR
jgi:integrase